MGMIDAVQKACDALTPNLNETYQDFAKRLYITQQETCDEYSGFTMPPYQIFELIHEESKKMWYEKAKQRLGITSD